MAMDARSFRCAICYSVLTYAIFARVPSLALPEGTKCFILDDECSYELCFPQAVFEFPHYHPSLIMCRAINLKLFLCFQKFMTLKG